MPADLTDPAAFWAALTTEQAAALLRAAPKIAGPWQQVGLSQWARLPLLPLANRPTTVATVNVFADVHEWNMSGTCNPGTFGDCGALDKAKAAADAALVAAGWRLL